MDPYSLKRDNRKKFLDKEKLKRRHATPSDRKYRSLNHQAKEESKEQDEEEEEKPQLQSNDYRYADDIATTYAVDDERSLEMNRRLKQVLLNREESTSANAPAITKKNLETMDVDSLNNILGRQSPEKLNEMIEEKPETTTEPKKASKSSFEAPTSSPSQLPDELAEEQDFLDDLI